MHLYSFKNSKPAKTAAVVRYGAFGDALQSSSVLPWLKEQGYHVTFYTIPSAYEVIKNDPHVDRFVVQDVDAIYNPDLGAFWDYTKKKYDRFINLSESTERTLLAMPGNMNHTWSYKVRRKYLDRNYMEFVHDIADVPLPSRIRFYPTDEEVAWALKEKQRIGGRVILWILAGSSPHKVWPHVDRAMDEILKSVPDARFVLNGDASCKMLEEGWETCPQVVCRSGDWTIRQTLAFAQVCDVVIGPETGVLNAVSMEHMPKIVILSHSSITNLTRDWVNTKSLTPKNTPCYPCHQFHTDFKHCPQHAGNSGVAACQFDISPEQMVAAIHEALTGRVH